MIRKKERRTYHFKNTVQTQQAALIERKPNPLHVVIVRVNVVRPLASLVFGKAHSALHRMLAGALVMALGVTLAKWLGHSHNEFISHLGDGVGYGLHGIGLIPFIEALSSKFE